MSVPASCQNRIFSLGFVGGGINSAVGNVHFSATHLDGRWKLESGVFSRNQEVNRQTGEKWQISQNRVYDSLDRLIEQEGDRLDAVAVLTPTPNHADVVCTLLNNKIPVICEKTLADTQQEMDRIGEQYCEGKNFLAVTYNYSGYPLIRELREIVQSGKLGTINQIHIEMPQEGFIRPPPIAGEEMTTPQMWRLQDADVPMVCHDLGVHLYHLMAFLTGQKPMEVMANFKNYSKYDGIMESATMMMNFASGMSGTFWFTKTAIGSRNGLKVRLFGDQGSAEWYQMEPEILRISTIDGYHTILDRGSHTVEAKAQRYNRFKAGHPSGFIEAFANLYVDIADALEAFKQDGVHHNPYVYGFEHSNHAMKLFYAATRSAQERRWQVLDI